MSDTARTAKEQLLISNAVDQALARVDFGTLSDQNIFLDEQYLDCVDRKYIVGAIRHEILRAGGRLVGKREEADLVVEVSSGAVGTDREESKIGIPTISVPLPMPIELPEINIASRTRQTGTAKLGLIAYDAKTGDAAGNGGRVLARSDDTNWSILGLGPLNTGSVREEIVSNVGSGLSGPSADQVALREPRSRRPALASRPERPPLTGPFPPAAGSAPPGEIPTHNGAYRPPAPSGPPVPYDRRSPLGPP